MDLLLRLLERRTIVGLSLLLATFVIVNRFGAYWLERADMMLHPPAAASSPLSSDILKSVEVREAARVRGLTTAATGMPLQT